MKHFSPQVPVQPPLPTTAQVGVVSLAPTSHQPRFSWFHALIAFGVLSASGAGSALLFKVDIIYFSDIGSSSFKSLDQEGGSGRNLSAKEVKASKSLAEETAEAAKAAASAAAIAATASQEFLNSKIEGATA
ncbi:Peroxisomal membrane protein PEX14 [Platanthera guangdongensis]|uniref:Peroxisomal membrane protein PEX14 n=1 Tax=Platanthera guangdongensis TaxID=2320717 RepID=A0ABR2N1Z2_9ASPA